MQGSWWQYRPWKFVADMNGDGALTGVDVSLWAQWLFFIPGDAFIAQFGPTPLGRALELTQTSFGGTTSAWISGVLWLFALWAAFYGRGFILDAVNPTFRQQQREIREAQAQAWREARAGNAARKRVRKENRLQPSRRIEPTLGP